MTDLPGSIAQLAASATQAHSASGTEHVVVFVGDEPGGERPFFARGAPGMPGPDSWQAYRVDAKGGQQAAARGGMLVGGGGEESLRGADQAQGSSEKARRGELRGEEGV